MYVGSPACADDVALLASSAEELQLMLQEAVRFARKNKYNIYPTKTYIMVLSNKIPDQNCSWKLGENTATLSDSTPATAPTPQIWGLPDPGKKNLL